LLCEELCEQETNQCSNCPVGYAGSNCDQCDVGYIGYPNCVAIIATFTLSVSTTGNGSGTVTSSPGGINCGADCSQDYDQGTAVTLNASPAPGSSFSGFSGKKDCKDGKVTVKSAFSCTATFEQRTVTFSIGGIVSGLTGNGLVLRNANGENLAISKNGSFVFNTAISDGEAYGISVFTQPDGPDEVCRVANGSGVVANGDISNLSVNCAREPVIFKDSF